MCNRRYWYDKATLCRMIIALVGPVKYGRKLWNMRNTDLEDIYDDEVEAYKHANEKSD